MRIAIFGFGNLGRGVVEAAKQNPDVRLVGIFSRRDPEKIGAKPVDIPIYPAALLERAKHDIDVLLLCGGSAVDLPEQTPTLARDFNVVDSFDTHAKIPTHFRAVDAAARAGGHLALISAGWDPGLFSLARLYAAAALPQGKTYTFWGRGVSEGHSDAVRRLPGVLDARAYTLPNEAALDAVRGGETPQLTAGQMHRRVCFVIAAPNADRGEIVRRIREMPAYFADYDTEVNFVTETEMARDHAALPHGGSVIRSGRRGAHRHTVEFSLRLGSNPEFTAGVLVACARAVHRMRARGEVGCRTLLDVAPADLSPQSADELRRTLL